MIDFVISQMDRTFRTYDRELKTKRENIDILKATNQRQEITIDDDNRIAELYGIFISYYFSINREVNLKKLIEKTKDFEDLINNCSESNYLKIIKAIKENRMSNIYLDDSLIKLYSFFIQYFNQEQIIHLLNIFVGNLIINRRMTKTPENPISKISIKINGMIGFLAENEVESVKAYDNGTIDIINIINEYIDDYTSNYKKMKKMADVYVEAQEALEHNRENPIMSIPERWKNYFPQKNLYILYRIVYNNQLAKNSELDLSLMKFSNTSNQDQLNKVLHKYQLSLELFINKELIIKFGNIKNIGLILYEFKTAGIDLDYCVSHGLEYVLIGSNPEIVSNVLRYVVNGTITKKFIENNLGIFVNAESYNYYQEQEIQIIYPLYEVLSNNINVYKSKRFDPKSKSFDESYLLNNPLIVNQTAELMTRYNLKNVEILNNPSIIDLIDLLIEKGYDVNDIDFENIKNNDITLICKRIVIACLVNIKVIEENKLTNEIVTGKRFIVGDDKLDDYIIDETESEISPDALLILKEDYRIIIGDACLFNETISKFDQTIINSEGNYEFDSLIISRNKVLRNLSSIIKRDHNYNGSLLPAIIYNSFLSQDEIEIIKKYLKPQVLKLDDN